MGRQIRGAAVLLVAAAAFSLAVYADEEEVIFITPELPKPNYIVQPLDYGGDNVEERDFRERPPMEAPVGTCNVALNKPVTASVASPISGTLEQVTDGDKAYPESSVVELPPGRQWVQIDLQDTCQITAVLVWHYHAWHRVYFDVSIQASDDPAFAKNVVTLFNNDHNNSSGAGAGVDKEYWDSYKGKLVEVNDVQARYIRLYSHGNTMDDKNHYVEVEVYGKPAE